MIKLKVNKNHYFTSPSRIVYIISRLSNKTTNYIINRKLKNALIYL